MTHKEKTMLKGMRYVILKRLEQVQAAMPGQFRTLDVLKKVEAIPFDSAEISKLLQSISDLLEE